jgi:hypothetical protein
LPQETCGKTSLNYMLSMETDTQTAVLHNADCPICSWEIRHYRSYCQTIGLPLRFDTLTQAADWGLTKDQAARRLYVLHQGDMLSGIPAFLILWQSMPRYRPLARLIALPGVKQLACLSYDHILAPLIYQWHLRRLRKARAF